MCRGRGYGNRGHVVGCQWEVKGHGGNGERSVHLYRSGSHTGKTLEVEEGASAGGGDTGREKGEQVTEPVGSPERRRDQMNKS